MSESVQFWLDNKMSAGIKVAEIGDQLLVLYRDKFYVVEQGVARMNGGKPLHYSKSSMPAVWKKALRGEAPATEALKMSSDESLPMATSTKRIRLKSDAAEPLSPAQAEAPSAAPVRSPLKPKSVAEANAPVTANKLKSSQATQQTSVIAHCPYCNHKHDLPLDKGRNGKPFFMACTRCKSDFAVRIVPVTAYQAQVAGFC
ncbi:MAG: hypothetical protein CXR30_05870 [Geobacter sp.]|nr:MAG: hypothetical protein CXR30_05870 [Geobacter sp.]